MKGVLTRKRSMGRLCYAKEEQDLVTLRVWVGSGRLYLFESREIRALYLPSLLPMLILFLVIKFLHMSTQPSK